MCAWPGRIPSHRDRGTLGSSHSPGQMWNQMKRIRCGAPGRIPSHRDRGTHGHTLQHTSRELRMRTTVRSMLNSHGNESCSNHVELRMRTTVNDVCHVVMGLGPPGPLTEWPRPRTKIFTQSGAMVGAISLSSLGSPLHPTRILRTTTSWIVSSGTSSRKPIQRRLCRILMILVIWGRSWISSSRILAAPLSRTGTY